MSSSLTGKPQMPPIRTEGNPAIADMVRATDEYRGACVVMQTPKGTWWPIRFNPDLWQFEALKNGQWVKVST